MHHALRTSIRAFFTDKEGNVVIAQKANAPLLAWFTTLIGLFVTNHLFTQLHPFFRAASYITIIYWALLEIFEGVCPWRKFLGLVVYTIAVVGIVRWAMG